MRLKFSLLKRRPLLRSTILGIGVAMGICRVSPASASDKIDDKAKINDLPAEMQGSWIGVDDDSYTVSIQGSRIEVMGTSVVYDSWRLIREDGAMTVELHVNNPAEEDDFQRRNITGLVISPEGEFFVYNVKYSMALRRQD
ncbi:hypothetical protein [Rhizobium sp. FKL33]|uniref:hypothetical protein n=1 Tax=Rhizobium sp. FKL33 TaxID=2562307 RepID=UPI00197F8489|nr:hypothetical protein [Rhizobium sp. FKL33]